MIESRSHKRTGRKIIGNKSASGTVILDELGEEEIATGQLEEQDTFAIIGATIADNFGIPMPEHTIGHSLLEKLN